MCFSTMDSLDYDTIVGAMLSKEVQRKTSSETSTTISMVARCRSKEKGKNLRRAYKSKSRVKKGKLKCSYRNKSSHFKKDCWKRKPSKEGSSK